MARYGIYVIATAGAMVALALAARGVMATEPDSNSIAMVAVDADAAGNGARSAGTVDDCVTAATGEPIDIDIVLPGDGVPSDRGIVAFALTLAYDPAVVWVDADGSAEMLLAQAPNSNVLPFIQDPKPDKDGSYISWAADFGPSGIEPNGTSEIGPGVIARLTLLPQSPGTSDLFLSDVDIRDDEGDTIHVESFQDGRIVVGGPCPDPAGQATPSATPEPTATPTAETDTATLAAATSGPSPAQASAIPAGGGAPPSYSGASTQVIAFGLIVTLSGAVLIVGSRLPLKSLLQGRRLASGDDS